MNPVVQRFPSLSILLELWRRHVRELVEGIRRMSEPELTTVTGGPLHFESTLPVGFECHRRPQRVKFLAFR